MAQLLVTAGSAAASNGLRAALVQTVAATAANFAAASAERLIFGPQKRTIDGPRLEAMTVQASTEGAGILRVYGRARVAGQVIWAADFKEETQQTTQSSGGKGGPASQTTTTEYIYTASLAIGLCEGEIDRIGRVWADGKPLNLSGLNTRLYEGGETQDPDPLIEAVEGAAPGFRGLAYIVFEHLPLTQFGNRIPQFSFEVERRLGRSEPDVLENALTAITMIPGSGEFVYGATTIKQTVTEGEVKSENIHNNDGVTDFSASLESALAVLPNLASVSLVVSWFGDDLRAGSCQLRPGVETAIKQTTPRAWRGGGVDRAGASLISTLNGAPAYGGTPDDETVIEAIGAMKAKGLNVMFHPFILMDIGPANSLPDPYGASAQAPFPWRGRITVGGNDKTAAAASDVASFMGTAAPSDFSIVGNSVVYSGPVEWSFRRMILHYAFLCAAAGGVDRFMIGSELRGLTTARSGPSSYPMVDALIALAADVRSVLGAQTQISYGADWSEYFGHQPADGSGDVHFHLDPFWASAHVDFIGIDNYMPLADWRDGFAHLDALAGYQGPYDQAYLKANVMGGEGYDWFYASAADRDNQIRTPITDGAYGEPWVYRYKDLKSWWENAHYNRPGGVRDAAPTVWAPRSKPFYFTETGCPAIDRGANQPNVFVDPKSSESAVPYYSSGVSDDLAQRRFLEALHGFWRDAANNPISSLYGEPMVDADEFYVYAWDARPYPFFPALQETWGDYANWETGHWLNGRAGRAPLDLLIKELAGEAGATNVSASRLKAVVGGYVADRPLSPRAMIDPLAKIFQFDLVESGKTLRFQPRDAEPAASFTRDDFVDTGNEPFSLALAQESDLPGAFRLGYIDAGADYTPAVAAARAPGVSSLREAGAEASIILTPAIAEARARSILADAWVMRESLRFSLPLTALNLEPGDSISVDLDDGPRFYRITDIVDSERREVEAVRVSPAVYDAPLGPLAFSAPSVLPVFGAPSWALMDLPLFDDRADPAAPWFAVYAAPWPGGVALYRSALGANPVYGGEALTAAVMGRLETALPAGFSGRWDYRSIRVRLLSGALASASQDEVLAGANAMAVENATGDYEIFQFRDAVLQGDGSWVLSMLLRGQAGGEAEAAAGADIGARVVLLNGLAVQPAFSADLRGEALTWFAGPAGEAPTGENFASANLVMSARGLQPLAPVHLKAARQSNGDYDLSWIRRSRIGGDPWRGEVPLGEALERYQMTIYDGANAVRVVEVSDDRYLYLAADVSADFGPSGLSGILVFGVRQWSDRVGWGAEGRHG